MLNKIEGTPILKLAMVKKTKNWSQKLVTEIGHKNSPQKFITKIQVTPSNTEVTKENGPIFMLPILVLRSSAPPASGRRA